MAFAYNLKTICAAEIIRKAVNDFDAMLYGGFVRDGLAKKDFNDIDLFFQGDILTDPSIPLFVEAIEKMGYSMFKYYDTTHVSSSTLWVTKYEVISNGIKLDLDLSQRIKPAKQNGLFPFEAGKDVDINNLYYEKDKFIKLWDKYPSTIKRVIENIKSGFYEAEEKVPSYQLNKIELMGYKRKATAAAAVGVFSSTKVEVKCHQCKKNVYPDEEQCWWCGVKFPGKEQ